VPDRHTADTITDDALDALYEQLAAAEQEADAATAAAAQLTTLVGKRSERSERAAKRQRLRADLAETELRTLRAGLRANGADPTQIQNLWAQISLRNRQWREEKQRAGGVEEQLVTVRSTIDRVRELHIRNANTGNCEHCSERDYPDYAVPHPCPTIRTLDTPEN
jgi:hypothetical protein